MYRNSIMFEMPSRKPFQNSQWQKYEKVKNSKSNFSRSWSKNRGTMIDIIIQKILLLKSNIIIKIVVRSFKTKVLFSLVIWYKYDGVVC